MNALSKSLGLAILLAAVLQIGSARGETIVYGHPDDLGDESAFTGGYFVAFQITVDEPVILLEAGVIFRTFGDYTGNLGLYTANPGDSLPDQLIATTGEFFVSSAGPMQIPFSSSPVLSSGTYWLAGTYSNLAYIGAGDFEAPPTNFIAYRTMEFTSSLPTSFGPVDTYTGWDVNYFIVTEAVPEPATTTLLVGGVLVAAASVRRRMRKA